MRRSRKVSREVLSDKEGEWTRMDLRLSFGSFLHFNKLFTDLKLEFIYCELRDKSVSNSQSMIRLRRSESAVRCLVSWIAELAVGH